MTLSEMCKFKYMFISEVMVKGAVVLEYFIISCAIYCCLVSIFCPSHLHTQGARILEPVNIIQSHTTTLTMTSVLKHRIELIPL